MTTTISDEEEIALLLPKRVGSSPQAMPYCVQVGDLLRVVLSEHRRNYTLPGMIVMARRAGAPDDDGDFNIWYVNSHGYVEEGYSHYESVEPYSPREKQTSPLATKRRRKLELR